MKCTTGLRPDEFAGLLIRLRDEAVRDCPACRSWDAMRSLRMMHADMPHSLSQEVIDDSSGACWRRWVGGVGPGRPRPWATAPGCPLRLFAFAAPSSVCCAPSSSTTPLLLVQWGVKRRSRVKGAQQMRTRTGPRSPPCTGPPPHSPLPPHWIRPSHRGRGRTGERRGPATRKGGRRASSRLHPAALIIALQHESW